MPATTIVTEDATTVIEEDAPVAPRRRFSWSAALAGAVVGTAVTLFLLTLGAGLGLSLVTTPKLLHGGAPTFLTLGAIYFLASYAFGFAVGGHLAGRLIGPAAETRAEEEFRAGAHGMGVWAIGVVATSLLAAASALVAEGTAPNLLAPAAAKDGSDLTPLATSYWVDVLFRSTSINSQASLSSFVKYAQAGQSDVQPAPVQSAPPQAQPMTPVPAGQDDEAGSPAQQSAAPTSSDQSANTPSESQQSAPADISIPDNASQAPTASATVTRSVAADKAEVGRILDVATANGGQLAADDRDQIARLVAADVPVSNAAAEQRVQDVTNRIRADEIKTAETARKVTRDAALWAALALLFGAVVATMAAVSARWEDDEVSMMPFARD